MGMRIVPTGRIVKEYMSESNISQKVLAEACGYSEKQISLMLSGKAALTKTVADQLERLLPGTTSDYWMTYDAKYWLQEREEKKTAERKKYDQLAASLGLDKIFSGTDYSKAQRIELLENATGTNDLLAIANLSPTVKAGAFFLKDKPDSPPPPFINLWIDLLLYFAHLEEIPELTFKGVDFLATKIQKELKEALYVRDSEGLQWNIKMFCESCGINVFFVKNLPTSYVRGMSFSRKEKVYIVLTDRFKSIEFTVFAFVHELMHILHGDLDQMDFIGQHIDFEEEANKEALSFLVGNNYERIVDAVKQSENPSRLILDWSSDLGIMPGVLVTILHHSGALDYSAQRHHLNRFKITPDFDF